MKQRIKYAKDSKHTEPWVVLIGKAIINFSAIEMESIVWTFQLFDGDADMGDIARRFPIAKRVKSVTQYVSARALNKVWEREVLKLWRDATRFAHVRNQVSHNPIFFSWSKTPEVGPPDVIGVPNVRARSAKKAKWITSLAELGAVVDEMARTTERLAELRLQWCLARDAEGVPPFGVLKGQRHSLKWVVGVTLYRLRCYWSERKNRESRKQIGKIR